MTDEERKKATITMRDRSSGVDGEPVNGPHRLRLETADGEEFPDVEEDEDDVPSVCGNPTPRPEEPATDVDEIDREPADEDEPIPDEPPKPTPVEVQLDDALGPAGPKEIKMNRLWQVIGWGIGIAGAACLFVSLVLLANHVKPEPDASSSEAVAAEKPAPVAAEPPPPPEAAPPSPPPPPIATVVEASLPEPEVTTTIQKLATAETVQDSLVISAMGSKPKCTSECVFADITSEGLPRIVNGKRKVVCGQNTWMITARTQIETGPQKYCLLATGISIPEEDPIGP